MGTLEQHLRSRFRTWSQAKAELGAAPGIRAVKFNSRLLREALIDDLEGDKWLKGLFSQLPSDTVVYDFMEGDAVIHLVTGVGAPYDECYILFASREWPPLQEGSQIPYLEVVMSAAV